MPLRRERSSAIIEGQPDPATSFLQGGWRPKAIFLLVVAITTAVVGVLIYGDAAGIRPPNIDLLSGSAFYSFRSAKYFIASVLFTISSLAWILLLAMLCTIVVVDTVDSRRSERAEAWSGLDDTVEENSTT